MIPRQGLADAAVDALAAVARMDEGITNDHDERHIVRSMKRVAEQVLEAAFRQARELAWLAEDTRREAAKARSAEAVKEEEKK